MRSLAVAALAGLCLMTFPAAPRAAGAARTVTLTGTDAFRYDPSTITAKPGEQLHIVLKVVSQLPKMAMAHNFILLKPGSDIGAFVTASAQARDTGYIAPSEKSKVLVSTGLAGNGETVETTFAAPPRPGTYTFFCSFPGHYLAGMKGSLVVK